MIDSLDNMITEMRKYHEDLVIYCGPEALQGIFQEAGIRSDNQLAEYKGIKVVLLEDINFRTHPSAVYVLPRAKPFNFIETSIAGQRVLI